MTAPYVPKDEDEDTGSGDAESGADVADADLVAAAEAAVRGLDGAPPKKVGPSGGPAKEAKGDKDEGEPERDEHGRFLPKAEKKPAGERVAQDDKPSNVIARELAKREAKRAEESQYKTKMAEAEQAAAKAQALLEQMQAQAAELAKEKADFAQARRDPAAFLTKVGWTADQFIDSATRSKDPIYQETVTLREELSKRDADIGQLREMVQQLVQKAEGYDKQTQQAQAQREVQEFLTSIPQDSPVWQEYEDREDLLYFAKKTRQRYYEATGKVASPQQLGEYLHYKALSKRAPSQESREQRPLAGKPKAKVPRALGGSEASERRGGNGVKHIHDMTPDEERQFLMDVATSAVTGE